MQQESAAIHHQYISRILSVFAKLWMSFPVSYLIYAALALGTGPEDILKVLLSPFYWFVSIVTVFSGYGLLRIKWFGWYLYIFSNLLIFYQTATILTFYSQSDNKFLGFLATCLVQALFLLFVAREVRVPYYFPKIRWWESDPRYRLSVQAKLSKKDGSEMEGEIMDISLGGCFIKTHHYFALEDEILLDYSLFDKQIKCSGVVVWRTESRVTHPKGIGVKFNPIGKENTVTLKEASKKLQKLSRAYTQLAREKNWQEYLQREQSYQGKNDVKKNK